MADETNGDQTPKTKPGAYGKRPLWQWILIYLIVGGLVYYAVYYFYFSKKGGYNSAGGTNTSQGLYQ